MLGLGLNKYISAGSSVTSNSSDVKKDIKPAAEYVGTPNFDFSRLHTEPGQYLRREAEEKLEKTQVKTVIEKITHSIEEFRSTYSSDQPSSDAAEMSKNLSRILSKKSTKRIITQRRKCNFSKSRRNTTICISIRENCKGCI